jgi:hypothetical protein
LHLRGQIGNAGLQLIDRVVQRLDLGRKLTVAGPPLVIFCFERSLQIVDRGHHPVHIVGVLLNQIDDDAHAFIIRCLQVLNHVLQLLDLGLQLDHFLGDGKCMRQSKEGKGREANDVLTHDAPPNSSKERPEPLLLSLDCRYRSSEKPARRFCCQQASSACVQNCFSLP